MSDPQNTPPTDGLHERNAAYVERAKHAVPDEKPDWSMLAAALAETDAKLKECEADRDRLARENEELRNNNKKLWENASSLTWLHERITALAGVKGERK